ncbi:YebB family permuted papain-like enzyme [Burkholderia sp. Ac-20353]|uniref:YebB family permuted papain-like enzyme n=1 Tax=Burkholderia sp. Ac-20353 TaxID=2703894 RepID=UPI00197B0D30|nr:YebB family permuted papain-like enzyme [Burkholderia sp. Ac-20353]MBN3788751.1 YebB family permuted papain-like enzyme [Burkholderia sp. Ac-20353]
MSTRTETATYEPLRAVSRDARETGRGLPLATVRTLAASAHVGDLVFIRVPIRPFREVADATGTWTNHVGIVVDTSGAEPVVAESTFPWAKLTPLARFVARSEGGRIALARLATRPTADEQRRVHEAAEKRIGTLYDTGFNLRSRRQFCSRYVREVLGEASGVEVGDVETFEALHARRPGAKLGFWRLWYFGRIPWARETVTPASLIRSDKLTLEFDGIVLDPGRA